MSLPLLGFGLLAAPVAWLIEELVSYGVASRLCSLAAANGSEIPTGGSSPWLWIVLGLALALSVTGTWTAVRNWRVTRAEKAGSGHDLRSTGDGRTRFVAMCSVLTSGGFLVALLFMTVGLVLAPLCRS